jgi:hypothetical protein
MAPGPLAAAGAGAAARTRPPAPPLPRPSPSQVAHGALVRHLLLPRDPVVQPVAAAGALAEVALARHRRQLLACGRAGGRAVAGRGSAVSGPRGRACGCWPGRARSQLPSRAAASQQHRLHLQPLQGRRAAQRHSAPPRTLVLEHRVQVARVVPAAEDLVGVCALLPAQRLQQVGAARPFGDGLARPAGRVVLAVAPAGGGRWWAGSGGGGVCGRAAEGRRPGWRVWGFCARQEGRGGRGCPNRRLPRAQDCRSPPPPPQGGGGGRTCMGRFRMRSRPPAASAWLPAASCAACG